MTFDTSVSLGQLLLTGGLSAIGWGLRKVAHAGSSFVKTVGLHGELIDLHSGILETKGLTDGRKLKRAIRRVEVTDSE